MWRVRGVIPSDIGSKRRNTALVQRNAPDDGLLPAGDYPTKLTTQSAAYPTPDTAENEELEPLTIEGLYRAGVHLGHLSKRWHPRMRDYIQLKHKRRHVLDMEKTLDAIEEAKAAIREIVASGGECLMVGTKPQARTEIRRLAESVDALYVNSRWLGGTLTNFATMSKRIETLIQLEEDFAKGEVQAHTKRELLMKQAEVKRLNKFFGGIKEISRLPQVMYVVGIDRERHAVKEANDLGIPVVAIVDTNCDPSNITYPIPGNDDSHASISLLSSHVAAAVSEGRDLAEERRREREAMRAEREAQEAAMVAARAVAAQRVQQNN